MTFIIVATIEKLEANVPIVPEWANGGIVQPVPLLALPVTLATITPCREFPVAGRRFGKRERIVPGR
jgi:hypothetical protein